MAPALTPIEISLDVLLLAVTAIGAVTDIWNRKIYDWLTYPALGVGLILHGLGFGLGGLLEQGLIGSIAGAAFCALVFGVFFFWRRGLGGGDVKMMAAVGALTGFLPGLTCAMCIALVGAVLALAVVFIRRKGIQTLKGFLGRLFRRAPKEGEDRLTVPYCLAIFLGSLWASLIHWGLLAGF